MKKYFQPNALDLVPKYQIDTLCRLQQNDVINAEWYHIEPKFSKIKLLLGHVREAFKIVQPAYKVIRIKPDTSVRNWQTADIAKNIVSAFKVPLDRFYFIDGWKLRYRATDRVTWEIEFTKDSIEFLLTVPEDRVNTWVRRLYGIWERATITVDDDYNESWDPARTAVAELITRKHDMYSLHTDNRDNLPLPSLLQAVKTLEEGDRAKLYAYLDPMGRLDWQTTYREAWEKLRKGRQPVKTIIDFKCITKLGLTILGQIIQEIMLGLADILRSDTQENKYRQKEIDPEAGQLAIQNLTPATKRKGELGAMRTYLWVAAQSKDPGRRENTVRTIAGAFADLASDNELEARELKGKRKAAALEAMTTKRGPKIKFNYSVFSTAEAGKIIQLPGRELQEEFPQVAGIRIREVQLPEELNIEGIKSVRLGWVTIQGKKYLAKIPLEAYQGVKLKHVYDALCTASFGQGKQGTGKSEGYGTVWAYDIVMAGFTVIIIDTADGQVLRNFANALPEDYPDEKLHLLNLDNKAWPMPLGWDDIYGRNYAAANGDEELAVLEIQERLTSRFVGFINSLSNTGEFSDRMAQYVISCMRAITTRPGWSFLDMELALTSPAYRDELLQCPGVRTQPDVMRDLETLQQKAVDGKEGVIIDPIMSRIKTLCSTQFLANLFYQEPKLNENGKPVFDLRRLMDNEEGGYGHVICVQASGDAWQEDQATILSFFEDKINFNAFSRIDQDQGKRKPVLKWIDEPHKVIKAIEGRLSGTAVEFRKYRVKNLFTGHSIDQMGAAKDALLDGGAQITSYKTERLTELARYAHMFKPYDDAKELYEVLPEKWRAINAVRLPSGKTCPAFLADMVAPPVFVKDRSYAWRQSAERYGRPWKIVRDRIQEKRSKYQTLDKSWREEKQEKVKEARKKNNPA